MNLGGSSGALAPYLIIVLVVIGRFLMRELRERRMKLTRIYMAPTALAVIAVAFVAFTASQEQRLVVPIVAMSVAGAALGCGFGFAVARFTRVRLAENPDVVLVLGSWVTIVIWLAALALRWSARLAVPQHDLSATLALNAALIVLVAAAVVMQRYRIVRAARVLRERGSSAQIAAL